MEKFRCGGLVSLFMLAMSLGCSDSPSSANNGGQGGGGGTPTTPDGGEGGDIGGRGPAGDASVGNSAGMAGESSNPDGSVDAGSEVVCSELSPPCAGQDCVLIQGQPLDAVRECISAPVDLGCAGPVEQGQAFQYATDTDGNCWLFGTTVVASGFTVWDLSEYPCLHAVDGDNIWPECPR